MVLAHDWSEKLFLIKKTTSSFITKNDVKKLGLDGGEFYVDCKNVQLFTILKKISFEKDPFEKGPF